MPICPKTGKVLEIPMIDLNKENGKIIFENGGDKLQTNIYDGNCKLQWKVDWACDGLPSTLILRCTVKILLKVLFCQVKFVKY